MALTVEELQIVLSCDATTAQAVLEKMDATVKAYTQKFQGYFNTMGGKGGSKAGSGLDNVVKNVERQTKRLAKAGSDWKKQYEQTFGETFESSMMKAKIRSSAEHRTEEDIPSLSTSDISSRINGLIKNGREAAKAYSEEFSKAMDNPQADSKLIDLGYGSIGRLESGLERVKGITDAVRQKIVDARDAVVQFGTKYVSSVKDFGSGSKTATKAEADFKKAIYAADKYAQQLEKISQKEEAAAAARAAEEARHRAEELARQAMERAAEESRRREEAFARTRAQIQEETPGSFVLPPALPTSIGNLLSMIDALPKVGSVIGKTFSVGAKVAVGAIRMIGTVAKITARAIGTAFKVAGGLIRGIVGAAQKVGSSIKKAFNNTLLGKFVKRLGTVMMRMAAMKLIRGTIDGVKKGLEELAKTSGSSAKAMNSIKAAGGSIKMALGAAVMPIVKALVPVFVQIAGVVNTAANAIARFFAVLTGQGQYTAVSFSGDLDGISESASGAGSAVKGMLADFDELNVLQKNSGGGGGGSSGVEQSLSTVADQNAFSELGEIIRNSILHGDWSGAATAITDKLNALIRDIPWGDIGTRIGTYLDGALEFLATAITTFDWNGIGASLAEACNAAIVRVNWENLGTVLSAKFSIVIRSLGSFLENLNFAELADGFSKFAIGFFDGITNAIESVDWKKIGENVKTFLKNVNWSGIADSIMEGIGAALGGLAALIWGLIEEAWDNVVKWWKDVAYEDGQFTISGLLDGIVKALSSIGTWIKEHIFNPIINGFKKAFGIASPAKEMNEPGQMVGEGILEGFANAFKSIVTWLDENIFTPLVNGIEEGAKAVWAWLETAVSNVGLFFDKVKAALGIGVEYVVAFFKTIVDTITAKADVIKLGAEKIVADVKTAVLQKLKDLVDALNDGPVGKLLKAIGVDLTNASASLGKKIDESKQKSQQLDSAIQDAQATASKGFDIEANVNQEKVTEFKKTLDTPYSAYVKPGIKKEDLNAYKENVSTNVTQTRNTNVKPVLADVSVYEGDVKKKVTKPTNPWQAMVNPAYNTIKTDFLPLMQKNVTGKIWKTWVNPAYNTIKTDFLPLMQKNVTGKIWKTWVNPAYNTIKTDFLPLMQKNVTGKIWKTWVNPAYNTIKTDLLPLMEKNVTGKIWKALVNPTYNTGKQFNADMRTYITDKIDKKLVNPTYGSGKQFNADLQTYVTDKTASKMVNPVYGSGKSFNDALYTNVTKDSANKKVNPYYNSDKNFFDELEKKITGVTSTTKVNPKLSVPNTYTKAVNEATEDKELKVKATLSGGAELKKSIQETLSGFTVKVTYKDPAGTNKAAGKLLYDSTMMASGGIAYGLTSAIIGEYAGARNNPEVVAPLNKLQGILERSNTGGNKDTMTKDQANTMIRLLQQIEKKELAVKPSLSLAEVVRQSNNALSRT